MNPKFSIEKTIPQNTLIHVNGIPMLLKQDAVVETTTENNALAFPIPMCRIYGSEISFEKEVPAEQVKEVCQDIWDNADKYSDYQKNSESAYYEFLKFLWVKYPDGTDKRLSDIVEM